MIVAIGSTADKIIQHLEQHCDGTYDARGQKIHCKSPFRQGDNNRAFELTIRDGEHGAWYDFVRGEGGSLYELADRLGIPRPKSAKRKKRSEPDENEIFIGSFGQRKKKARIQGRTPRPTATRPLRPVHLPGGNR